MKLSYCSASTRSGEAIGVPLELEELDDELELELLDPEGSPELDEELELEDELELLELDEPVGGSFAPPPHAKSAVVETSTPASFMVRIDSDR